MDKIFLNGSDFRSNALKTVAVRPVNKDGTISKMPMTNTDWQLNAFGGDNAIGRARYRQAQLSDLNPGRTFAIVEIAR